MESVPEEEGNFLFSALLLLLFVISQLEKVASPFFLCFLGNQTGVKIVYIYIYVNV